MQLPHILQRPEDPQFLHSGKCLPLILQEPQKLKKQSYLPNMHPFHLEASNCWPETNKNAGLLDLASEFLDFSKVGTLLCGVRDQACSPALDWQGTEALLQLKSLRGYRITPHSFCCHPLMKTANLAQGAFHRLQNSAWQSCWCCWHLQDHLCNQTHWSSVGMKVHLDFWNHLRVRMHMNSPIMSHWIQFTWI